MLLPEINFLFLHVILLSAGWSGGSVGVAEVPN
jgi:hypothetical protein